MNRDLYQLYLLVREWNRMLFQYKLQPTEENFNWVLYCEKRVRFKQESLERMLEYQSKATEPSILKTN